MEPSESLSSESEQVKLVIPSSGFQFDSFQLFHRFLTNLTHSLFLFNLKKIIIRTIGDRFFLKARLSSEILGFFLLADALYKY